MPSNELAEAQRPKVNLQRSRNEQLGISGRPEGTISPGICYRLPKEPQVPTLVPPQHENKHNLEAKIQFREDFALRDMQDAE